MTLFVPDIFEGIGALQSGGGNGAGYPRTGQEEWEGSGAMSQLEQ